MVEPSYRESAHPRCDHAVSAVRIALALCDRFAEILRGPDQVTSSRRRDSLFGASGNEEALSMRIGEAQQLYPEIWRHLDEARIAFADLGHDVSAYDHIRSRDGVALGAAVDVRQISPDNARLVVIRKTANFNRRGHALAREASEALMRATPQVQWAEIALAETNDPAIAAFTRATRFKRRIRYVLLFTLVTAPIAYAAVRALSA